MKRLKYLLPALVLACAGHHASAQGVSKQEGPLLGQSTTDCSVSPFPGEGDRPVIDGGSATLFRTPNGITAAASMPTPVPGSYCYPPATLAFDPAAGPAVPGFPEAFSFWGIYFNNPDQCLNGQCSAADVLGPNCVNAQAGAVKLGGHIVGGPNLQMAGHLQVGHGPLGPLGCAPLTNVEGAEIHLAIAPHGMLNPELLPDLIGVPPGGGPGYWFPAVFKSAE